VNDFAFGIGHHEPCIGRHSSVFRQFACNQDRFLARRVIVWKFLPNRVTGAGAVQMEKIAGHALLTFKVAILIRKAAFQRSDPRRPSAVSDTGREKLANFRYHFAHLPMPFSGALPNLIFEVRL